MDGPKPVGEGGEAINVVARLEVDDIASWPSGRVVAAATAVLVVGVRGAVLHIVLATLLSFIGVTFTVVVVDTRA